MLISAPKRFNVPWQKDHWFEFKKLSWKELRLARKKQEEDQREVAKSFGAEFLSALTKGDVDEARARRVIKQAEYAASSFDTEILLVAGITSWSYEEDVSIVNIEKLDERTAVWAAQAIIDLTKPPTEEEEKNS